MANLKKYVNKNTTVKALDEKVIVDFPRGYPGISGAGERCLRKRQFDHHFCAKGEINARTNRIFSVGHLFEEILREELLECGYKVWGDQTSMTLLDGRVSGHNDGFIEGIPEAPKTTHILEIKTMNDKAFKDVKKKGVLKSKPVYYTQMQLYMEAMKLDRALFISVNKNDCEYYVERVKKDKDHIREVLDKTIDVLDSDVLLFRISDKQTFFECGWCDYKENCHNKKPVEKTCRSCIGSKYVKGNTWDCFMKNKVLDRDDQIKACDHYSIMEMFDVRD